MNRLYFRCNGGHYFAAALACPWDGWSCDGLQHALDAFAALRATEHPTIDGLARAGVSAEIIRRTLLIEFGNPSSAFDALSPSRYRHGGRELLAHEVDPDLY